VIVRCAGRRHMFRPVSDGSIAQIINGVEQEKMRLAQLSALSTASSVSGNISGPPQPMAVDEPEAGTSASHQQMECSGW